MSHNEVTLIDLCVYVIINFETLGFNKVTSEYQNHIMYKNELKRNH